MKLTLMVKLLNEASTVLEGTPTLLDYINIKFEFYTLNM